MEEMDSLKRWEMDEAWDPMEFLARSWSISAMEVSSKREASMARGFTGEDDRASMADSLSQLLIDRIMGHQTSPVTSESPPGSHSRGSPYDSKAFKFPTTARAKPNMNRWMTDRRQKKREEERAHNARAHAAAAVAAVAAAVAAMAANSAAGKGETEKVGKMDAALAAAATLVAAHCVESAECSGAERARLEVAVGAAVRARTAGEITALTAAAASALRGTAAWKARALKEVWNVASVVPLGKNAAADGDRHDQHSVRQAISDDATRVNLVNGVDLLPNDVLAISGLEFLSQGSPLLKRTRNGDLHWKIVSVLINNSQKVMLKMKSSYAAGTITKTKKYVVMELCKDVRAWPGRPLLDSGERRRYFGLKTTERRVIEFECQSHREYDVWTQGVARLLELTSGNGCMSASSTSERA